MLGQATGNTDTQDSPQPGLGGSHHLPPYSILCGWPQSLHPNGFSLPGSLHPKSRQRGLPWLWSPITLWADLGSRCGLKQSCSSRWDLSNSMSHSLYRQVNRVDSWLFVVGSQTASLTPSPSFGHNLCFKCLNEQCEPILDIYVQELSNDIKNATSHRVLTLEIALWNFESPPGLHFPKWELPWECECSLPHTPSHSWECVMWFPGSLLVCTLVASLPWLPSFLLTHNLATPLLWSRAQG